MPRLRSVGFAVLGLGILLGLAGTLATPALADAGAKVYLHKDWQLQSSCEVKAGGEQVSVVGFDASKWHRTDLPNTVVGALVDDKTYPDPTYGMNLKSLPGMDYSSKTFFALQDMPKDSPFRCSWWFRTEFTVPAEFEGKAQWLDFLGINYRANVWINGKKVADEKDVAGTYVTFQFNVNKFLVVGKPNALAAEIFAPQKNDLGITWVDWNPTPADKDMGIWKEVFLTATGGVSLRNPFVSSKLDSEYKRAALTISADLRNSSEHEVSGTLRADIDGVQVRQLVKLAAGEAKTVTFSPETYSELKLAHPRLWWPYQMGKPNLYTAKLDFDIDGHASDAAEVTFGIREATSELTDKGYRLFKINGRKVLIRGAAWAPDMFLRWSPERLDADLAYVRDMGLNTVRL
jgi:exo-1,4-beta-D-glucosaminidase